ncbi:MAG: Hsp20/alpha crystallin family protein [Bacteroidales bacterium]|jgi:HSP20 family protein|nr:Hsp20/alpha crystallin family protein [Bacteroidales bacterium]MDD2823958.1 Hsp20/alpha crystallin family protein [Bacteroidales bacterium]MDD3100635.1 Hsp20/alpha crystallin family protein [Bacteroidales bacterium]MDD3639300.1 Hsp20/alpha crystallin family protein [Bacteroidales bacterium]MDD3943971.1 Hsp20/alpha crystallin family protein [Bacteroidales bacterium]
MLPTLRRTQNWWPSLFNEFFDNDGFGRLVGTTSPAINVIENPEDYRVEVAAPGMTKEDFCIRLDQENRLIICLEKKVDNSKEDKNGKYLRREFSYSHYEQAFLLPDDILKDKIQASMENGVLRITIPKDMESPSVPKEYTIEIR